MTPRRVALLLVAGLALIAFAIWLASTRHLERATLAGDLVLPGLAHAVNSVTAVDLRKGDGTHTTLQKGSSGWQVAERAWPADAARLRKLLLDLGALTVVEEKTRLPANYAQLGVEDVSSPQASGTRVDVIAAGPGWTLIVGKSSSGKSGYVRVAGKAPSLLAAPLLTVDADPKGWLDHALIDLNAERVREVLEHPAGGAPGWTATRIKQGEPAFSVSPLPPGRSLSGPAAADPLAAGMNALLLEDVRKVTEPAPPQLRATFRTFDGLELNVAGRKDGQHPLITVSARAIDKPAEAEAQRLEERFKGWEFEIAEYRYTALFRSLDELLAPVEPARAAKDEKPAAVPVSTDKPPPTPPQNESPPAAPAPASAPNNNPTAAPAK